MQRIIIVAVVLLVVICRFGAAQSRTTRQAGTPEDHIIIGPEALKWQPLPTNWADGPPPPGFDLGHTEVAIIRGDPIKEGESFVFRLRSTPGTQLPPHWHSGDEQVTVISGTWCVGMGDKFDAKACRDMGAGSYIFIPKGMRHFAVAKGDVVQVHGVGPFTIHWVK
jgi:quercetin dioxygenase-like cupin family protein